MSDEIKKTIDIDDILRSKLGDKAKHIPHFAVGWLKKIVHQDEVNQFLCDNKDLTGTKWLEACVKYLDVSLEVIGRENLPNQQDGRLYIFASNHPLGGADGVALGTIIGRRYDGHIKYLLNDLLMNLPGLRPLGIGINKMGRQSRGFPALVDAAFQSDNHIIMFPAGLCSRKINGQIRDVSWKKTFINKSVEYRRDVVPIHFDGRNSDRFYRIANICDALKLKFNVAMLFLVDEMFRNRHKTFRVTIGEPIPWQTFDKCKNAQQWAQYVRDRVYHLQSARTAE